MTQAGSPRVEMLWESSDPGEALRTRFGFDAPGAAVAWVTATLDGRWDLRVESCERIVISYANALAWVETSSGPMIAKWSVAAERFAQLAALARLTAWLHAEGIPVSAPVPTPSGDLHAELDGVSLGLQRQVDGDLLDPADAQQVRAAGATLARLHDALARWPEADRYPAAPVHEPLAARVGAWLDAVPAHLPPEAQAVLRRSVADAPPDPPPVQLVHGDVRSANLLCAGGEVAAVLDFEEARFDHRVAELARSAVLLGTRFHDWGPVTAEVRAQLLEGYESVRPLTASEAAWWPALVLWESLRMVPSGADPTGWRFAAVSCAGS
ncbi:phosphotransferase [Nocardioides plantarum]|uniref:Phosphotransferase n=1 Tax=Nocardioides plantarum TaxID=29299 RepID=A0ABV5KHZ6_9ACTN|nr:phosphotransferase [Nocardioides plantarum]